MPSKQTSQVDKIKKVAREPETDDSEKRFNEKLGKIAKQKSGALKRPRKQVKKRA